MKLQKIGTITKYKSFKDYSWPRFLNADQFHQKVNIVYGENGSGKTSISNILKSVSQEKDFYRYFPEEVKIRIDNKDYKYSNKSWQDSIERGSFLFFDREFVDDNVHLGRSRGTQQNEQEQKSAKLIIEFDAGAIKLRKNRDELLKIKEERKTLLDQYQTDNQSILGFALTEEEDQYFKKYKNLGKKRISLKRKVLDEKRLELEGVIKFDSKLQQKAADIQQIPELDEIATDIFLSPKSVYQSVFSFKLKEKRNIKASKDIIDKIAEHKGFFEEGFAIREEHEKQCPFCQAENREKEIKKLIKVYEDMYDESYDEQKTLFEQKKQELINELDSVSEIYRSISISQIFLKLKRLSEQYSIKKIYSVDEEEQFTKKLSFQKLGSLKQNIEELDKPNNLDVARLYSDAKIEFLNVKSLLIKLNKLIIKKNRLINSFKLEHTDIKINKRIENNRSLLDQISSQLDFLRSNKIDNEKQKRKISKKFTKLEDDFNKAKENHRLVREEYQNYCSTDAFSKTLEKIQSYFQYFNFDFKLSLDTQNRHTSTMTDLPFAFKILDSENNERDLREGLSEGEVQVLSICFFLAFLEIQTDKDKKILVFDDPITSLDDSNLSNLVDLVAKESKNFSQMFILTHHRTFFKFLRKKFGKKQYNEYLILRNRNHLGGSFICKSKEERFIPKLNDFETHLSTISRNPNGFDIELKTVEYGQYLRYEIEHFIKCKLLCWDKSDNFADVVDGIKQNKKVDDEDLDKIKQIYSFCNWTTSHVDVGDDHGLTQLKEKTKLFVEMYDRYKNAN